MGLGLLTGAPAPRAQGSYDGRSRDPDSAVVDAGAAAKDSTGSTSFGPQTGHFGARAKTLSFARRPFLVIGGLIRSEDCGPVFFRQVRVGRGTSVFTIWKFRSMVVDAESVIHELTELNESDGPLFKIANDPRVTRIGAFLRRYSLDELPQLFNVLSGSMSLVGPRPPLPTEVDVYAVHVHRRQLVKPGMTGLWQVTGRSDLSWDESVRLDLYYVENWSVALDVQILWKTLFAVLRRHGAY